METLSAEIEFCSNYPNPFSNSTTIQFSLSTAKNASLKIYNSFGQLLATLVDDELCQGIHSYEWQAENFAAGIYSYVLQVNNEILMKKMIIVK